MAESEFYIDYDIEVEGFSDEFQNEVETRLRNLASDHTDLIGAAVAVTEPVQGQLPYLYQARIVAYVRPEEMVAIKKDDSIEGALKAALSAIERQVREKREKLGKPWKRNDLNDSSESSPSL